MTTSVPVSAPMHLVPRVEVTHVAVEKMRDATDYMATHSFLFSFSSDASGDAPSQFAVEIQSGLSRDTLCSSALCLLGHHH